MNPRSQASITEKNFTKRPSISWVRRGRGNKTSKQEEKICPIDLVPSESASGSAEVARERLFASFRALYIENRAPT